MVLKIVDRSQGRNSPSLQCMPFLLDLQSDISYYTFKFTAAGSVSLGIASFRPSLPQAKISAKTFTNSNGHISISSAAKSRKDATRNHQHSWCSITLKKESWTTSVLNQASSAFLTTFSQTAKGWRELVHRCLLTLREFKKLILRQIWQSRKSTISD